MRRFAPVVASLVILAPAAAADTPILCHGVAATVIGTPGDDVLRGTPGPDIIVGREGDDRIFGMGGRDRLCGGPGNDVLIGGIGRDALFGDDGRDRLIGGRGNDRLAGGPGPDLAAFRSGPVTVNLAAGTADGRGHDRLDEIERVRGSRFDDVMIGSDANEGFFGLTGDDLIDAAAGANRIDGGPGTDWCYRAATDRCEPPTAAGRPPFEQSMFPAGRPFSPTGPWNTPLRADAPLHPDGDRLLAYLVDTQRQGFVASVGEWTYPVFVADENTPTIDIDITARWSPYDTLLSVPMPAIATPDPRGDGHLAIVDATDGYVYELWQFDGGRRASWANRLPLASDGFYPTGMSAKGSGSSLLAGVIWPHELADGHIDHALHASIRLTKRDSLVAPATESDGRNTDRWALPEGARLRLDPTFDVAALDPWERTIVLAMQQYGIIIGDNGGDGTIGLYVVNALSFDDPEFPFALSVLEFPNIPVERLQVLDYTEIDLDEVTVEVADTSIFR